ncbi:MAG: hypothetical protein A2925_05065 [Candidatus Yanofskybacteria bacterium RIFCSPLOWO2_01_FULL_44_22]|uniref:Uncharacterized protein n=1 Tax=Candidatus Yanofskybacteria bacterium RIFCSPLOWO2_01_FULL_44_22 TaxID=1802697 RepID=A0A1F8GLC8_9BACT|nr:MAG: hypothetical protein A2925_05065 [Candidatus Yanofskybacteria bacterium RIFCSPLOWO2_01_FULL_44_22]
MRKSISIDFKPDTAIASSNEVDTYTTSVLIIYSNFRSNNSEIVDICCTIRGFLTKMPKSFKIRAFIPNPQSPERRAPKDRISKFKSKNKVFGKAS